MIKNYKKIFLYSISLTLIIFTGLFFLYTYIETTYTSYIYTIENVPENTVWLVLWAGAKRGRISDIYKDRLKTAIQAYQENKIQKILVSGDNGSSSYDELTPAKNFLFENGVKKEDIFLDYAGFDTYDSIYRAREIFLAPRLTIFTQDFHLKRALYICDGLDIECVWVATDLQTYIYAQSYKFREVFSRCKAFLNVTFASKPKFLGDTIDIMGESNFDKK